MAFASRTRWRVVAGRFSSEPIMRPVGIAALHGVSDGLTRLSVGREKVEDVLTDLAQALPHDSR